MQDKKPRNGQNEGGSLFVVVGTFHEGVKRAEKSKLRNGREEFLWKEKDKKDVSVWELKTSHPKNAFCLKRVHFHQTVHGLFIPKFITVHSETALDLMDSGLGNLAL